MNSQQNSKPEKWHRERVGVRSNTKTKSVKLLTDCSHNGKRCQMASCSWKGSRISSTAIAHTEKNRDSSYREIEQYFWISRRLSRTGNFNNTVLLYFSMGKAVEMG